MWTVEVFSYIWQQSHTVLLQHLFALESQGCCRREHFSPEALHVLLVSRLLYQVVPLTSGDSSLPVFVVQTGPSVPPALSAVGLTLLLYLCLMTLKDDNSYCLLLCLNLVKVTQKFCDSKFPQDGPSCVCG